MARKILLADDSVTAQNMGRKILADAGYDIVTVNNGSAALKRIAEIKPDLIVLDVYMPGYSGLEVCQRLKDAPETAHIPVLLTVGKLEPFKPEEARRVRADAHIVKPFEASELLSAITRLEDRMVPQAFDGARAATEASAKKVESGPVADAGWKSRIGFPSKKKKEEAEEAAAESSFRDFRKGKSKTGLGGTPAVKAPEPERAAASSLPRDITPEELDALSALAAKLDGPIAAAESPAPAAVVEEVAVEAVATAEETAEVEAASLAVVAPVSEVAVAVQSVGEVEIPVQQVELAAESVAVAAEPVAEERQAESQTAENQVSESQHSESQDSGSQSSEPQLSEDEALAAAMAVFTVNTAPLAQEPAPVDRNDEPIFSSAVAVSAVEAPAEETTASQVTEAVAETAIETQTEAQVETQVETQIESQVEAQIETAITTQPETASFAATELESKSERSETQDANTHYANTEVSNSQYSNGEALPAENAAPSVPSVEVAANAQEMAPEEPGPSDEDLAQALRFLTPSTGQSEASQVAAHESAAATGPRWVAEPVALSPEDAVVSLEAEMFRTLAAAPAAMVTGEIDPVRMAGVSAIAAAVESRLAAVELAASAHAAAVSSASFVPPSFVTQGNEEQHVAEHSPQPEPYVALTRDEAPAEAMAVAAGADGENQNSSSNSEDDDSMGKTVKSKSGKSNGREAHTVASEAVETEEAPKAMAAVAAEGSSSSSVSSSPSASDASSIASIVDSVMNDLRPKIVEEIAKRLAGK